MPCRATWGLHREQETGRGYRRQALQRQAGEVTLVSPRRMQLDHLNTSWASREEKPVRSRTGWNAAGLAHRGPRRLEGGGLPCRWGAYLEREGELLAKTLGTLGG